MADKLAKLKAIFTDIGKNMPAKPIQRLAWAEKDGRYINIENMRGSMAVDHICNTACKVEIACHWINR